LREMRPSPIALISSRACYTAAKTRLYGRALASVHPETLSFWNHWLNSDF
jgi:hypothetical protein